MINLARSGSVSRQAGLIAAQEMIPPKFLEAIMVDLRRANLVVSTRGRFGGHRLARPADLITMGEILRVTDGALALIAWASRSFYRRCDDCQDEVQCALRRIMTRVRNEVSEILDGTTLVDAVGEAGAVAILGLDELGPFIPED